MVIAPSTGTGGAANMPHYPVALRVWCVIAYGLCLQHQFAPVAAAAWLDAHWEDEWGTPPPDLAKLIRRMVQTFKDTGSVHDRPRSGRPHLLPGDEADRAIALIKQGYTVSWRPPGARENQVNVCSVPAGTNGSGRGAAAVLSDVQASSIRAKRGARC
jgi:hypothetical protein